MAYWWLFWIIISCTHFNEFKTPSYAALAQYLLLLLAFLLGHIVMKSLLPQDAPSTNVGMRGLRIQTVRVRIILISASFGSLLMLLLSLYLAGAFGVEFNEYYTNVRILGGLDSSHVTGVHALDVLTKILAFPLAYSILVTALAVDLVGMRTLFFASVASFILFSYLWQINYPLIHMFWIVVFYTLVTAQRQGHFNRKIIALAAAVCLALILSSVNRFNGAMLDSIQHYMINYHLIGFTFYDHHYADPNSILHAHSFGLSSLGFLDQVFENLLKPFSIGYQAASSENADFLNASIDIGASEPKMVNAFGTIIFTFYRDFNLLGIFFGGFIYGSFITFARYRSNISWRHGALFLLLASAWMMGMMVSPVEAVYFWFVIAMLALIQLVNRGVKQ